MAKRTLDELVDAVVLKGHIAKADIEDEAKEWLNEAYMKLSNIDLACFETTASLTLLTGVSTYVVSTKIGTDVRKIIALRSTEGLIELIEPARAKDVYFTDLSTFTTSDQYPSVAWEYNGVLTVYPTPDTNYAVYVDYFAIPTRVTELDHTFLIPEYKEDLLINYAVGMLNAREKDWDASDRVQTEFMRNVREWQIRDKNRYARNVTLIELQRQYNETYGGR